MPLKMYFLCLMVLAAFVLPVAAQEPSSGVVAITDNAQITLFANDNSIVLADIPSSLPIDVPDAEFSYEVSSDHQWVMQTSYWPAVIAYGQVGKPMTVVPLEDEAMNYRVLSATFSPDNRYLVFTIGVEFRWKMGFVNLESGELSTFEGEFAAIEPDMSPELPFGNMVPTTPVWSLDGTRLYLETMIPFWGCRGPHDLYAIDISNMDFAGNISLPPTVEIAQQGNDLYTYAFSPDQRYLAYVFEDESCGYLGERALALANLTSEMDQVLVEPDEDHYVSIIGWPQQDKLLYSRSLFDESIPTLYLYDVQQGEAVELPALNEVPGIALIQLQAQGDSVFYSLASQETYNPSYPTILYHRFLNDAEAQVISETAFDWTVCGNTLYFVEATPGSSLTLFSQSLASITAEPVELGTAKTMRLLSCTLEPSS